MFYTQRLPPDHRGAAGGDNQAAHLRPVSQQVPLATRPRGSGLLGLSLQLLINLIKIFYSNKNIRSMSQSLLPSRGCCEDRQDVKTARRRQLRLLPVEEFEFSQEVIAIEVRGGAL